MKHWRHDLIGNNTINWLFSYNSVQRCFFCLYILFFGRSNIMFNVLCVYVHMSMCLCVLATIGTAVLIYL